MIEMTTSPQDMDIIEGWDHVLVDMVATYGDHGLARVRVTAPHAYDVPEKVRRALLRALREYW
jgi:hypothetical protein